MDRVHNLSEEASHYLAVESLSLMSRLLIALMPSSLPLSRFGSPDWAELGREGLNILVPDLYVFCAWDESRPGALPPSWDVTSDSLAARVAEVMQARELILLKSVTIPPDMDWSEASRRGYVDAFFPTMIARGVRARAVNFREWRP